MELNAAEEMQMRQLQVYAGLFCGLCNACNSSSEIGEACGSQHLDCSFCNSKRAWFTPGEQATLDKLITKKETVPMATYTYTPLSFPSGTRIRTTGSSGEVTHTKGEGEDLIVFYTSDNSLLQRSTKPNKYGTAFREILTPAYEPKLGDRVRVSTSIPGFIGSMVGVVTEVFVGVSVKADADGETYNFDRNVFSYEKLEPTWEEKLDALDSGTLLRHSVKPKAFVVKGTDGQWRTDLGIIITPAVDLWVLPTQPRVQDAR